jgi:hypothetical protein
MWIGEYVKGRFHVQIEVLRELDQVIKDDV